MTLLHLPATFILLCCSTFVVHAAQTFWPAAIPLAIRTPYLNAWIETQHGNLSSNEFPFFWNRVILGWICYIRVDGMSYTLFGNNGFPSNYSLTSGFVLETRVTPTRTIQVIQAGNVNATVTFLSLVDPSDLVRQSLPFAYTAVDVVSTDGQSHDIQLYSDISGEWLCGLSERATQEMTWSTTESSDMVYHQLQLAQPSPFQEADQQASDGTVYHAMALGQGRNVTWQTCEDTVCRKEFILSGGVNSHNNNDTFRNIQQDWPVFPISVNLGSVVSSNDPIVWVLGYVRNPSINYTLSGEVATLRPYYTVEYATAEAALEFAVSDFNNSLTLAKAFDAEVYKAASNVSADGKLYDMLSLATRQVYSSLEITAPQAVGEQTNNMTRVFMKDMGYDRRVTPVETLYAALPMFLHYNASFLKPLLEPLLEQQNSSTNSSPYAAKDIGDSFPVVSGPTLASEESVERKNMLSHDKDHIPNLISNTETSNMLIIALAHAQYANDTSLLHDYYGLFKKWANYLLEQNGQFPYQQSSIDDGMISSNSSNLAVKAIFALQAMADISRLVGTDNDTRYYNSTASSYISTWKSLALSSSDDPMMLTTLNGSQDTWSLPYNLYPQTMLGFSLVEQVLFEKLTVSYGQQIQPSSGDGFVYGMPIEEASGSLGNIGLLTIPKNPHFIFKGVFTAWNAFTAATFANDSVRTQLLGTLWEYASNNQTNDRFSAVYNVESGQSINGRSSPALGGLFAPLVRSGSPGHSNSSLHSNDIETIVGGVVGGIIGLLALLALLLCFLRRRMIRQIVGLSGAAGTRTEPTPFAPVPAFAPRPPVCLPSEKFWREKGTSTRPEEAPLLPSTGNSSTTSNAHVSNPLAIPLEANSGLDGSRQDELLGLRSEIQDLRRIMNVHLVGREPSDLGAPPEYS
ncbi:hypothetical protein DAEQUDRAFT_812241 [Daedalea quercina L-15889]|uniref:DUF1793-domain-containing protein n=1 Tax=Daedalea quercina L-15889 TaxID=1314783 RepID=A0A165PJA5_9APHY|nr:hypothetical protein DAEQUDRAFT_812241 [Daedalea quercina L-15889]